jgi:predicted nucleic-acid-binding Zn-ribbon protein
MSNEFQCPKCGGHDTYMANKTIMGGIGGIYGNRSKDVMKPFCRTCDIEALPISRIQKANKPKTTRKLEPREIFLIIGLFVLSAVLGYSGNLELSYVSLGISLLTWVLAAYFFFKKR